jgi:hypothetical protein
MPAAASRDASPSLHLNVVSLPTPFVASSRIGGYIRKPLDAAAERNVGIRYLEWDLHVAPRWHVRSHLEHRIVEAVYPHSLLHQPREVHVADDHLLVGGEAFRFGQQLPVLVHHPVAIPGEIRRRFTRSSGGVRVGGNAAPRLRRTEEAPIIGLANRDVARREVD